MIYELFYAMNNIITNINISFSKSIEAYLQKTSSSTILFLVNHETKKLIAVIRDLPFLIALNCAHDLPLQPSVP